MSAVSPRRSRSRLACLVFLLANACQSALHQGLTAYERGDCGAAIALWQPLAEQGDAEAEFLVGLAYDEGRGVARDATLAADWYARAANQDHARAQNNLGLLHYRGDGVLRSHELAAFWFTRAANKGNTNAADNLGLMHLRGEAPGSDVDTDPAAAVRWLRSAAEHGHPAAQFLLGWSYLQGQGTAADPDAAHRWLTRAAAQGQPAARKWLALERRREPIGQDRDAIATPPR